MKINYLGISAIFMMAVVLAMSGCSGGNTGGQATPTATPGGATATPAPGEKLSTGSLFDSSSLSFYEWRWTATSGGKTDTAVYRKERGTETYKGAQAKYEKMIFSNAGEDPSSLTLYYSPADKSVLGGKSNDEDILLEVAQQMAPVFNAYDIGYTWANADYPLSNALPEPLTINGKLYSAKKYSVGNFGVNWAVWVANVGGKDMAVQLQYGDATGNVVKYQLWDWG